jgi:hypothetical protein
VLTAGGRRGGGGSRRGPKAQTPVDERDKDNGDKKNKKPEIEHYIPKKKSEVEEKDRPPDEGEQGAAQDGGPVAGGGATGRKSKKRKAKPKANPEAHTNLDKGPVTADVGSSLKAAQDAGRKPGGEKYNEASGAERPAEGKGVAAPFPNDDITLKKMSGDAGTGRHQQPSAQSAGKARQEKNWRADRREDRPALDKPQAARRDEIPAKAPESLIKPAGGPMRTEERLDYGEAKRRGNDRGAADLRRSGREGGRGWGAFPDSDGTGQARTGSARDDTNKSERFGGDRTADKGIRKSKSEFWNRTDGGGGRLASEDYRFRTHHEHERRSEPKENGFGGRNADGWEGPSSTWSRGDRRGRGGGDPSRWSRHSSPSRSSRGNSPTHR